VTTAVDERVCLARDLIAPSRATGPRETNDLLSHLSSEMVTDVFMHPRDSVKEVERLLNSTELSLVFV